MDKCTCGKCGHVFPHWKETHNIRINGKDVPITVTNAVHCPECKSKKVKSNYDAELMDVEVTLRQIK